MLVQIAKRLDLVGACLCMCVTCGLVRASVAFQLHVVSTTTERRVNNAHHDSITWRSPLQFQWPRRELSSFLSAFLGRAMPKLLVPSGWVEKPCRYFCHESTASSCGFCEEEFGFWNGRRHCHFCGHMFHRRQCTKKIQLDGLFFRRRICPNCDYYRNVAAEKLKKGQSSVRA